jgi:hypothetical protein
LKALSKSKEFLAAVRLKESDRNNGTAEEYVLRFFAYLDTRDSFEHSVKDFLNDYMKANASKSLTSARTKLFKAAMAALAKAFPAGVTRGQSSTTSAVLFEALAVGTAMAIKKKVPIKSSRLKALVIDKKLRSFTTGATNSRKMLTSRIEYVANYLE